MLSLYHKQIYTNWQRRFEVLCATDKRVYVFEDTSRSAAMLRKLATIVFYSKDCKDFVCLLDGARYDQIVSTDILDRDPSIRDLVLEETRLQFRGADLWSISADAYSPIFGYRSKWKSYLYRRLGYDMPTLEVLSKQETPAAAPIVAQADQVVRTQLSSTLQVKNSTGT